MSRHNFPVASHIKNTSVAYIADHQFPLDRSDADADQVINTVSSLGAQGLDVTLIIPKMWENMRVPMDIRKKNIHAFYRVTDDFDMKELLHLPLMPLRLEKYSHALLAAPYAKLRQHDVVYARNRAHVLMALTMGMKVVFETYRQYSHSSLGFAKLLATLTHRQNLLGVIHHSSPSQESLLRAGANPDKTTVIHNGFNPQQLEPRMAQDAARQELGWEKEGKTMLYAGRLDKLKGVGILLELAERMPDINFHLVGKTVNDPDDWIEREVMRKGIRNVRRFPWVAEREISTFLYASDVLVIPPAAAPLTTFGRTVLPLKTFTYMATGIPILAPQLPDTAGILTTTNCALVEPDNPAMSERTIRRIFRDKPWATSIGTQAQRDAQNYTWTCRAQKILAFLDNRLAAVRH